MLKVPPDVILAVWFETDGVGGWALIVTADEAGETHPDPFVTVKL
jgi:hypothetical protein